jgi:hypothetical protein
MGKEEKARRIMRESRKPDYATVDDIRGTLDKYSLSAGDLARLISDTSDSISYDAMRKTLSRDKGLGFHATRIHRSQLAYAVERLAYETGLTEGQTPS